MRFLQSGALTLLAVVLLTACGSDDDHSRASNTGGSGGTSSGGTSSGGNAGSGGDAGSGTGGNPSDAGGDAGGAGQNPITAPEGVWTWVDFPDAFCANGDTTGIGVNLAADGAPALIFLAGGGGCWDEQSCYVDKLAANIETGFDEVSFQAMAPALQTSIFDRNDPANPFKDAHHVFVPYCTGDTHLGDAVQNYGGKQTKHVGYANIGAYLARLVPTFSNAPRIVLGGTSAGGFGAIMNAHRTQLAFAPIRVDTIDDAGPWLPNPYLPESLEQQLRTAWGTAATLPSGCAGCATELAAIYPFAAGEHPNSRFALLVRSQDNVVKSYMSLDDAGFTAGLSALEASFDPHDNLRYFEQAGTGHGLLGQSWGSAMQNGIPLKSWLADMLTDAPGWQSVEP